MDGHDKFSVVSYNVLADSIIDGVVPSRSNVAIEKRYALVMKEIMHFNPDVICLQEVEKQVFHDLLEPHLKSSNYSGIFTQVGHTEYKTTLEWANTRLHGCATFWRTDKFRKAKDKSFELRQSIYMNGTRQFGMGHQLFLKDYVRKSNIVTLLMLETIDPQKPHNELCVANTHLLANVSKTAVRTVQARAALHCIQDFLSQQKGKGKAPQDMPIIFAGDFNSFPGSSTYRLMKEGTVDKKDPEMKVFGEHVAKEDLQNPFSLNSLYSATIGEPPLTSNFGTVDYVWFTPNLIQPTRILQIPKVDKKLPSLEYPSDHLLLFGEFFWHNKN
uniref:Endonuclease/exonuclease/phosphatase domain-containing protein n=1 Tax=Arcella intermedia TaxID=1963864 RepID=A0A6B2L993_9EUKA